MEVLQDTAKELSDDKQLIVMFASSESSVPNLMNSRSSASRLIHRIQVTDITDEQALDYLSCLCNGASKDELAIAVQLVGGHFVDLLSAAVVLSRCGEDQNETLEQRLLDMRVHLEKMLLSALSKRVLNALYEIVCSLISSSTSTITLDEYKSLVDGLDEDDLKLIDSTFD